MLAELIFLYCLICNEPAYQLDAKSPALNHEIRLELKQDLCCTEDHRFYLSLAPYLKGSQLESVETVGLHVEIGYQYAETITVFLRHHSAHRADRNARALEYDTIGLRIRFN